MQTIETIAQKEDNRANAWARGILKAVSSSDYVEPIVLPSYLKSSPVIPIPTKPIAAVNSLIVYPNPAKDFFIVRYELDNDYAKAKIQMVDITGRKVKEYVVTTTRDYLIVPVTELKSGMYVVKLILNGREKGTQKVNIQN